MCIIIYHEGGDVVPEEHFDNSIVNHPDGYGLTYMNKKGRIIIYKNLDGGVLKKKYYDLVEVNNTSPFILHFRNATHGTPSTKNCHPFRIDKDYVFAHNGTVHPCIPHKENIGDYSDTRIFNEDVLRHLPDQWFMNQAIEELLEDYIGASKLAIMNKQGSVWLINGHKGTLDKNIWYSNESYKNNKRAKAQAHNDRNSNKHWRDEGVISNVSDEWPQDGLRMRWCMYKDAAEAYNPDMKRWNVYDLNAGHFLQAPFTCKGHTPKYGRFSITNKDKVLNLVHMNACSLCLDKFRKADLKNYVSSNAIYEDTCEKCYKFLLSCDPTTMEHTIINS